MPDTNRESQFEDERGYTEAQADDLAESMHEAVLSEPHETPMELAATIVRLRAELERVTAERDAAEDRAGVVWDRYQDALQEAGDERDALTEAEATIETLTTERDGLQEALGGVTVLLRHADATVEAWRPVVEAAKAYADNGFLHPLSPFAVALDALRAKESEDE